MSWAVLRSGIVSVVPGKVSFVKEIGAFGRGFSEEILRLPRPSFAGIHSTENQPSGTPTCSMPADRIDDHAGQMGMSISEKSPLVVCFGDSLTAGFQSPSGDNLVGVETPYGVFLQEMIGPSMRVAISGICGELTGEMVMRFRHDVISRRPTHVIILGGTNDLGWNGQTQDIMRNLVKMYEQARADRIIPVPVTVPSIRVEGAEANQEAELLLSEHLAHRRQLNALILQYADLHQVPRIDLFAATAEPKTQQLAAEYSNDGLHLTTAGYRKFAQLIYERVFASGNLFNNTGGSM